MMHHASLTGLFALFSFVFMSRLSAHFVGLYNCLGLNFCYLVYLNVGSVMVAPKRMALAKAMKAARAAKAGAPSLTLPSLPPTTAEPPLGSSSPPTHGPQLLQTPNSPPPIAAVPLAVASSPAPAPLDKGKRVLEVLSDDEDSDDGVVFKRRKVARVPIPPPASPQGGGSFRDNPPSATSPIPATVQGERGDGAKIALSPTPAEVSAAPAAPASPASPASPAAAPDLIALPPPIIYFMRGFNWESMPESFDRREGIPFYMEAFLAVALDWRTQARMPLCRHNPSKLWKQGLLLWRKRRKT